MYTTHMNFDGENLYSLFGVSKDASGNEIRKAYLNLIRKIHPDKQNGANQEAAHEKAAQLNNVYEVLKDVKKRAAYDAFILRQQTYGKNTANSSSAQNGPRTRSSTKAAREQEEANRNARKHHANQDSYSRKQSSTRPSGDENQRKHNSSERPHSNSTKSNFYTSGNTNSAHQGRYSSSSKHSTYGSSANSKYGNNVPPPRQSSYSSQSQSNTRSDSGQYSQSRNSGSSSRTSGSSSRSKIYGVCKNGLPCKRCMKQGGFCYQHANQQHSNGRQSENSNPNCNYSSNSTSGRGYKKQNIGICKSTGQPCKRCLKQGAFCFQHLSQAQGRSGSNKSNHSHAYSDKVYGVTLNGAPCKRCLKQGGFCYQHKNQQKAW
ncbi:hypothetical protein CTEN210_10170 [Chaetoceros tenuissimus]|uniref:J domain-containing protein n=1 Tax=Chaetoceros tenuissimus TaxID=426638 RepID=A0AAD3CXF9_9STRA|nr:hypothetical protein CTEN210_10170 [Chaetoceros tenuissimus]